MAFSKNLRYLRKKHNMTQEDLANKLGYKSFTTIQKWESGISEPTVSVVKKIAAMFNVTMNQITNDVLYDAEVNYNSTKPVKEVTISASIGTNFDNKLLSVIHQLSPEAQEKVLEYAEDLLASKRYSRESDYKEAEKIAEDIKREKVNSKIAE